MGGTTEGGTVLEGVRRVRIHHLAEAKRRGERFAVLTAYDRYAAQVFEDAGIPVLLVGDSAANVLGHSGTVPVTTEELLPMVRAVAATTRRPLVVADLPFGSYQAGPGQALGTAVRMLKEGLAHAVKLEGGRAVAPSVAALVRAGIPVMGHLGFTPQSEHGLGGYRVQGRGDDARKQLLDDAQALEEAGAFAVVLEMVAAATAAEVTAALRVPTIGIGAGPDCDGQVLVWQDALGLGRDAPPRFVRRFADLQGEMVRAAGEFAAEVAAGRFPGPEHGFEG